MLKRVHICGTSVQQFMTYGYDQEEKSWTYRVLTKFNFIITSRGFDIEYVKKLSDVNSFKHFLTMKSAVLNNFIFISSKVLVHVTYKLIVFHC